MQDMVDQPVRQVIQNIHDLFILFLLISFILLMLIYKLIQHPNYKLTSDYDPKNTFDIEKYLNRKEKIHPGDEFIVVDADSLPSA